MKANLQEKISSCFENPADQILIQVFLQHQGVKDLEDLNFIEKEEIYKLDVSDAQIDQFLSDQLSDEFNNILGSVFKSKPEELDSVRSSLTTAQILDQNQFLETQDNKQMGLTTVQYKKIKEKCIKNNQPASGIKQQQDNVEVKFQEYPKQTFDQDSAKIILVVGETGSGKTTFLNFMTNYLSGVQFSDSFRYRLIQEDQTQDQDQTQSQTKLVQNYFIRGTNQKPNVIVVDTPGFGDTKGILEDKKTEKQLGDFFLKLKDIHLIAFVMKSSVNRLTEQQHYILNAVLQLFGKDVAENIVAILTFSDSQQPNALSALQAPQSPFSHLIKIYKNLAIQSNCPQTQLIQMYWDFSIQSFDRLFSQKVSFIPRKQLIQTGLVISEREALTIQVEALQIQLNHLLQLQHDLKEQKAQIEANRNNIENNKNYEIRQSITGSKREPIPAGVHITNCVICQSTCHSPCQIEKNQDKQCCAAIKNDYCTVCVGRCHWQQHQNDTAKYVPTIIEKIVTQKDIFDKFCSATSELSKYQVLMNDCIKQYKQQYTQITSIQVQVVSILNRLDEIALMKPQYQSQIDYIEIMIINEQQNRLEGWQNRLKIYQELKSDWQLIETQFRKQDNEKSLSACAEEWLTNHKKY